MHDVLRKLTGGDLRSKGCSDEVVLLILVCALMVKGGGERSSHGV